MFPTCEHGTSRWTDYDNICGRCEDGIYLSDGMVRRRFALSEARMRVERYKRLFETSKDMRQYMVEFDTTAYGQMMSDCLDVSKYIVGISDY